MAAGALGQLVGVYGPVGLRERGKDHQAEQLVAVVLRHDAEA